MTDIHSTTTTVFGTGNMGSAIGGLLERAGGTVQHIDSATSPSDLAGDVVILAVPYESLRDIVAVYGEQLSGKVVVDLTNPVDFDTLDSLKVPADGSAAAELQETLPQARVVKAFNTNFAGTLSAQQVGPLRTTVLVAGDDADAKAVVLDRVEEIGLGGLDAGSLARAREMEALGFLQISLASREKVGWSAGFGLVTG